MVLRRHGPRNTALTPLPARREVLHGAHLPAAGWIRGRVGPSERWAIGPDGTEATLLDNLIFLRRHNRTD